MNASPCSDTGLRAIRKLGEGQSSLVSLIEGKRYFSFCFADFFAWWFRSFFFFWFWRFLEAAAVALSECQHHLTSARVARDRVERKERKMDFRDRAF